jgi:hypothetical protein
VYDIIKILLPLCVAYYFGKKSYVQNSRKDILEKQLKLIYFPIIKTIELKSQQLELDFVEKIYSRNYILISDSFKKFYIPLSQAEKSNSKYVQLEEKFIKYVKYEYEHTRKKLGYPSMNFLTIFKFMSTSQ